ncbi:hypothetical protein LOZ66_004873 [Ophidiomyces ophidiicola]|nr:hypothetical protein LOZ65_004275 [Ophidiomyces ophidiicola]KAI1935955.1 hypothetical protein LOZ66_004873 [Ophidiomyces ophidiicola]
MLARRLSLSLLLPVLSLALPAPPGTKLYYVRNSAGQYLSPYHVEAGRSSAVFVQGTEAASQGYLNGTNQMFQVDSDLPWSMLLAPERYSEWAGAFLAADSATPGFSIEGSQLIWKNDQGQQGWLASTTDASSDQPTRTTGSSITNTNSPQVISGSSTSRGDAKPTRVNATTTVDPRLPPGGIKLITPAPIDGTTYVKMGDFATFSWNYTSVKITPSAIDIVAFCSKNQHSYTIAANQSVQETGGVIWDTSVYKTEDTPLLTEIYTLLVYDVAIGPSNFPAGRLAAQQGYRFGIYSPMPYTPLSQSDCVTCLVNGAVSGTQQQALFFMFTMVAVTIFSFSWFASAFGLFA